jgi:ankyrin repeat protein
LLEVEALIEAAKTGDEARVRAIVDAHPHVVVQRLLSGESPLMTALYRGHRNVVAALVELGAELDVFASAAVGSLAPLKKALAQPEAVNAFAYDGWTPLHLAAFFGQLAAATSLLDAGADYGAVSRNSIRNTPLHAAVAGRHGSVALLLLNRGSDPHAVDAGGFTPLAIARENELAEVVRFITGSIR